MYDPMAEFYYVTYIKKPLNQAYVEKTKNFKSEHEAFKFASRHNTTGIWKRRLDQARPYLFVQETGCWECI